MSRTTHGRHTHDHAKQRGALHAQTHDPDRRFYVGLDAKLGETCNTPGVGLRLPVAVDDRRVDDRALSLEELEMLANDQATAAGSPD